MWYGFHNLNIYMKVDDSYHSIDVNTVIGRGVLAA